MSVDSVISCAGTLGVVHVNSASGSCDRAAVNGEPRGHGRRCYGGAMERLPIDDDCFVLVLTGAGVSAESGIPTFRDANGLWENHRVEEVASPEGFAADPILVWRFYSQRREAARRCEPNPGHQALVTLERRLGDRFLLATQNVDGLHRRAGSERLVELHGNLFKTRCARCARPPFDDDTVYPDGTVPACAACQARGQFAPLRPHIVWFGEFLDPADLRHVDAFIERGARHRLLFLAVGTSGVVYPAAGMVNEVRERRGDTWLVNAEPAQNAARFDHFVQGPSGVILPQLIG
jgi:NAD-dependent deacetylase